MNCRTSRTAEIIQPLIRGHEPPGIGKASVLRAQDLAQRAAALLVPGDVKAARWVHGIAAVTVTGAAGAPSLSGKMDWSPLWLSLRVAGWATVFSVLLGLLIALPLARRRRLPGRPLWEALTILPLVLPPTVLGYALLVGLGHSSVVGHWYHALLSGRTSSSPGRVPWSPPPSPACPCSSSTLASPWPSVESDVISAARTDGASNWAVFRLYPTAPGPPRPAGGRDPGLRPRPR